MNERPSWRDAEQALGALRRRQADLDLLHILTRLPFVDVWVLQRVAGLDGAASIYRRVSRLREAGLIDVIHPALYPRHSPQLFYLTDLGLATIALDQQVDPRHLAAQLRLRGHDLLALTPHLPQLLATYELLAGLAAARLRKPKLESWERPWRRRYYRPTGKRPVTVALPASAVLSWNGNGGTYFLLPDRGTVPLSLYRSTLDHLLAYRHARPGAFPMLVIGTNRTEAWKGLLEDVYWIRQEFPLRTHVADWNDLNSGFEAIETVGKPDMTDFQAQPLELRPFPCRHPGHRIPQLVGDVFTLPRHPTTDVGPGRVALAVTPQDHTLLREIGFHPFLPPASLATILGWQIPSVRRRLNRLVGLGLLRFLAGEEIGTDAELELIELTTPGLGLVAAYLGLSLTAAIRELGLTGGGPDHPVGSRIKLVRNLAHTRGADEIFVGLYRTARQLAARGGDDNVLEWQNAAACSRRHLRPDGRGSYRRQGKLYDFLLEYDRGTMNARDYFKKFGAYYRYSTTHQFERDYSNYPTVLVVSAHNAAEDRIARVACALSAGQTVKLPLLLTCQWRIEDPLNPYGLLGRIWRESHADFDDRRSWLPIPNRRVP